VDQEMHSLPFKEIWLVDFEFNAGAPDPRALGHRPNPVCLCALELKSGKQLRLWHDELGAEPPYSIGENSLFVSFFATAEIGCHLALGWEAPARILDPYVEHSLLTNGKHRPHGRGLLAALMHFGLPSMLATEKTEMRDLILRGEPWTEEERRDILNYCWGDVDALGKLLPAMLPHIDLGRALYRGRYMSAVAHMEHNGVPLDAPLLARLKEKWTDIQDDLIGAVDVDYGVFANRTFKRDKFATWLARNDIPWPRLDSGELELKDDTFRQMAKAYPAVSALRELLSARSELRLNDLAVGADGRNRYLVSPFSSRTGRNQPSSSKAIFGNSVWLRGLIKPAPGHGVAYIDWSQQEFGIAASLSGDQAMMAAYQTGDPYLEFAKQARAVPADATKQTHGAVREQFKQCALAVLYGMGPNGLAGRIAQPVLVANELVRLHKETYRRFWEWSDEVSARTNLVGYLDTCFGWRVHTSSDYNDRSMRNFPMQAHGAEMMRLAACLATEAGIEVCAPIHDAFLISAPLERLERDIAGMQAAMAQAAKMVLGGFELGSDVKVVRYPNRYMDEGRGRGMWDRVMGLIGGEGELHQARTRIAVGADTSNILSLSYLLYILTYGVSLPYHTYGTIILLYLLRERETTSG
jgi:DNA polymerase-1